MKRLAIFATGLILGLGLAFGLPRLADRPVAPPERDTAAAAAVDDDDDDEPDAPGVVRIGAAARSLAAIETVAARRYEYRPEARALGRVVDSGALLSAQAAAAAAAATTAAQAATEAAVAARLERLRKLNRGGQIGVNRDLAELELVLRHERERGVELAAERDRLERRVRDRWGAALAAATRPATVLADSLDTGAAAVIEFALEFGLDAALAGTEVSVASGPDRSAAHTGTVIGPAPAALAGALGTTWYAAVPAGEFRRSAAVDVWLPRGEPVSGVLLPPAAIVWHGGSRWYYVARADDAFERRSAADAEPRAEGYVVPAAASGDRVVSVGAQSLLAEEFRGAIPDEDDD